MQNIIYRHGSQLPLWWLTFNYCMSTIINLSYSKNQNFSSLAQLHFSFWGTNRDSKQKLCEADHFSTDKLKKMLLPLEL